MNKLNILILAIFVALSFASCSWERQIANQYIAENHNINLLTYTNSILLKENLRNISYENFWKCSQYEIDSTNAKSKLLKNVKDSIFFVRFYNAFYDHLKDLNINVIPDHQADSFLNNNINNDFRILKFGQIELEELNSPLYFYQPYGNRIHTHKENRTAESIHIWLELRNPYKGALDSVLVLYNTDTVIDKVSGNFVYNSLKDDLDFNRSGTNVELANIYTLAESFGKKNAEYLYDYFLNKHIEQVSGHANNPDIYFHYDPIKKQIIREYYKKFTIINPKKN